MERKYVVIDPLEMPVCPICDNGMCLDEGHEVSIIISRQGNAVALAHSHCVTDEDDYP